MAPVGQSRRRGWVVIVAAAVVLASCGPTRNSKAGSSHVASAPSSRAWTSIQHEGGWSFRYPTAWRVHPLVNDCSGSLRGAIVSNTSFRFTPRFDGSCSWRRFGRWIMAGFPPNGVALAVEPKSMFPLGGPDYPPIQIPAALGSLHLTAGMNGGPWALFAPLPHFVGDNYGYEVRVWIGRSARGVLISLLQDVIGSVRIARSSL